jgi:aspartyl-tRNA(Asn)/glutamyl-tRNA(Gln) amidotransferase subunit C
MSIEITDELVRHVARLSRLAISDREAAGMKEHFEKILAFISSFQALDTKDVDPTMFSVDAANVFREDRVTPSLPRAEALRNAPQASDTHFIVPRVIGAAARGEAAAEADDAGGSA